MTPQYIQRPSCLNCMKLYEKFNWCLKSKTQKSDQAILLTYTLDILTLIVDNYSQFKIRKFPSALDCVLGISNIIVATCFTFKVSKGCKDQESIQSSTTPDLGYQWESVKLTVIHNKREPRGQPFPSR